jgi:hypothetical protein
MVNFFTQTVPFGTCRNTLLNSFIRNSQQNVYNSRTREKYKNNSNCKKNNSEGFEH